MRRNQINFWTSLCCLLSEASCAYFLSFFFSPDYDLLKALSRPLLRSFGDLTVFNISLNTMLGLYFCTQIFRFFSQLTLGHGFFDPLFGLQTKGNFISTRLLGSFRIVLDTLLFPFLFFHRGRLFSKPTSCELISRSQVIQVYSGRISHVGFFLTPIFVVLSLYSPLLMGLTLFDGVRVTQEQVSDEKEEAIESFQSYEIYSSELYGLQTFSSLGKGRFVILPQFDLSRSKGRLKLGPHIRVYDSREGTFLDFKLKAKLQMPELFRISSSGVPFWSLSFPNLAQQIKKLEEEDLFLGEKACKESLSLIKDAFELRLGSLSEHSFKHGPFLRGFVQLRQALLSVIESQVAPEVDLMKLGNHDFLRLRQIINFSNQKSTVHHTLIPLCVFRAPVYQLSSQADLPAAVSRRDFMRDFFGQSEWLFENLKNKKIPEEKEFTVFDLLDHIVWSNLDSSERKRVEGGVAHFYFKLASRVLEKDETLSRSLREEVIKSFERGIELLRLRRATSDELVSDELIIYLDQTMKKFETGDKDYFGLTKGSEKQLWKY